MDKVTKFSKFVNCLFDDELTARKAAEIIKGMIQARSPWLSDISSEMKGNDSAN